jgi:pilus assembly protein CpaD
MRNLLIAIVCLASATLAACGDSAPEYATADSPKNNRVVAVRNEHVVRFAGNSSALDAQETARLARFLGSNRGESGAVIAVGPGTSGAVNAGRERAVRDALVTRGYRPVDVVYVASADALNQVTVSVASTVVVTPRCPDYSKPTEYNYSNTPHSNHGCANTHNLGVMVADPADLIRGRDEGGQDGSGSVLAIQRYRVGKVTPLLNGESGTETGSK